MIIGILGGSFNPPHRGHLALAQTVLREGLADAVRLIPAAVPPHKANPRETPEVRLAMTRLLAGEDRRLDVDDMELHRSGPSYTIDTVHALRKASPGDSFRLIIGSDQAKAFATWKSYRELLEIAAPLVAERPDFLFTDRNDFPGLTPEETATMVAGRFPMEHVNVSSTMVRDLVREGAEDGRLLQLVTPDVLEYIRENHLYC